MINSNFFRDKNRFKLLIREVNNFSIPLILNSFFNVIISTIIVSIVGRISINAIASTEIVDSFTYTLTGVIGVGTIVFNINASRVSKDSSEFLDWFKSIIIVNFIIGTLAVLLTFVFSNVFFSCVYSISGSVLDIIVRYSYIQSLTIFINLMIFCMSNMLKVRKKTKVILYAGVIGSVVQLVLSYILTFYVMRGEYRVLGVAISSCISLFIELVIYMFSLRVDIVDSISVKSTKKFILSKKSLPFLFQEILEGSIFSVLIVNLITRVGIETLSAYSVCMSVINILLIPMYMYCNSLTVIVGEYYAGKNNIMISCRDSARVIEDNSVEGFKDSDRVSEDNCIEGCSSIFIYDEILDNTFCLKILPLITIGMTLCFYIIVGFFVMIFRVDFIGLLTDIDVVKGNTLRILGFTIFFSVFQIFFENTKYALQSIDESVFVFKLTVVINSLISIILIGLYVLGLLDYKLIIVILAVNYICLSIGYWLKYLYKIR